MVIVVFALAVGEEIVGSTRLKRVKERWINDPVNEARTSPQLAKAVLMFARCGKRSREIPFPVQ